MTWASARGWHARFPKDTAECSEDPSDTSFWVFVDLAGQHPVYFIAPRWWVRNDIWQDHTAYLAGFEQEHGQRSYGSGPNYAPGWSDSFFCNKTYDTLYHERQSLDGAARAKVVLQMQKMLYDDPYVVLYYGNDTQAFRSDKFTGFAPSPDNAQTGEYLYEEVARWSYYCIRPAGSSRLADRSQHRM